MFYNMTLPLIYYPNPILKKESKKIDNFSDIKKLAQDMIETMDSNKGIGLAAPQIGKNIRLAIISKEADESLKDDLVLINPKIFSASKDMEIEKEGCLSVPNIEVDVKRHKKIKIRFLDENGKERKLKATGLFARVIQHEIDHLDGVLIIDK